jgi:uncharacterized protein (DUF2384 family)
MEEQLIAEQKQVIEQLCLIFNNNMEDVINWLETPNCYLSELTPLKMMFNHAGIMFVVDAIHTIKYNRFNDKYNSF